jgi:hypothetical protein
MKTTTTYTEHHITFDTEYDPLTGRMAGKSFINMKSVPYKVSILRTKVKKGCGKGGVRTIVLKKPKNSLDNLTFTK